MCAEIVHRIIKSCKAPKVPCHWWLNISVVVVGVIGVVVGVGVVVVHVVICWQKHQSPRT